VLFNTGRRGSLRQFSEDGRPPMVERINAQAEALGILRPSYGAGGRSPTVTH